MSQLPTEHEHFDVATAAYNAVLMMDVMHNHPLKWAFERSLVQRVKALRTIRKAMRSERGDTPHARAGDALEQHPSQHSAGGVELELGAMAPRRDASDREGSRHGGRGADPTAAFADPGAVSGYLLSPKERGSVVQSREVLFRLTPRQQRIRNRWHLAVTLSRMPWLASMRRRNATHELVTVWPRASLDGGSVRSCRSSPEKRREMRAFDPSLHRAAEAVGDASLPPCRRGSERRGTPVTHSHAAEATCIRD